MSYEPLDNSSVDLCEEETTARAAMRCQMSTDNSMTEQEDQWYQEMKLLNSGRPWYKRPSKKVLYIVLSLHTLSFTILMSPLVVLMLENICTLKNHKNPPTPAPHVMSGGMEMGSSSVDNNKVSSFPSRGMNMGGGGLPSTCKNDDSQLVLSNVQSIASIISGIFGFTLSGKYGQWSDVYGRVFVFKVFGITNVIYIIGLIVYFELYGQFNSFFLVFMVSIGYLNGGVMTLIANGNSYLNDLVSAEDRTVSISQLMAFIYSMLGFGPLIGSFAIKKLNHDNSVVLYLSLGFGISSLLMIFSFLRESRHPQAQIVAMAKFGMTSLYDKSNETYLQRFLDSGKSFFHPIRRLWLPRTPLGSTIQRRNLFCLVLIDVLVMAATVGTMHTFVQYTILRYNWTSVEIGYYMSITGFGKCAVLLVVSPLFVKLLTKVLNFRIIGFGLDRVDRVAITLSTSLVVLSCVSIVALASSTGAYISALLQSLAGLLSPTIQAAVVKYSDKTTAGEMFGAMALFRHLAMLIIPAFFLQTYKNTLTSNPDTFLWVALLFSLGALLLAVVGLKIDTPEEASLRENDQDSLDLE